MASNERMNNGFWQKQTDMVRSRQAEWYKEHVNLQDDGEFSAGGVLNGSAERVLGSRMYLAGPIVDKYLKQIGQQIESKLSRSKATGKSPPISMFVPEEVMVTMEGICVACGVRRIERQWKKSSKTLLKKLHISIDTREVAQKVFAPARFDGTDYLAKRFFCKSNDSSEMVYNGLARVVVTPETPICMDYVYSKERVTVTCFIQRYNADGSCVDSTLQQLVNSALSS